MSGAIVVERKFVDLAAQELRDRFPAWSEKNKDRIERAIDRVKCNCVSRTNDPNLFLVFKSSSVSPCQRIDRSAGTCTCEDFQFRQSKCKHRIAVYLAMRALEIAREFDDGLSEFLRRECDGSPRAVQTTPRGVWEWIDGSYWGHRCADGFEIGQDEIFGFGGVVWCARCNESPEEVAA